MFARVQNLIASGKARGRKLTERNRIRFAWFDHLIRTFHRYQVQMGDRLAGAFTYFAFLSFFPLIALAFALFGFVVTFDPQALDRLETAINEQLPGIADKLDVRALAEARRQAGIIGLLGLLYAGLGAIDALRTAFRDIWMSAEPPLNFFVGKLRDLVALVLIGITMVVSVAVAGFANGATETVVSWLGFEGSTLAAWAVAIAGVLVSLGADVLLFLVMFGWLAKPSQPFKSVLKGAILGAVLFGILKQLATLILSFTLNNPLYGAFAVMVGLLLWINFSARVILYSAAWTATSSMGPPPEPSPVPQNAEA